MIIDLFSQGDRYMYISIVFLAYMFSLFIALTAILLVMLVNKKQEFKPSEMFNKIRYFALSIMILCAFYLVIYFRERYFDHIQVEMTLRIIEYILYAVVAYLWLRILVYMSGGKKNYYIYAALIGGTLLIQGVGVAAFFMDNNYYIANYGIRMFAIYFEFGITFVNIVFTCLLIAKILRDEMIKHRRTFVVIVSVMILVWNVDQCIVDYGLYSGTYEYAIWNMEDPTAILMLIIALFVLWYIFKEDFSPIFYSEKESSGKDIVETIAESHKLTVRECEVLRLIYAGYTNAEISDELNISINTVKKHTQNMYEKLAIGNRMELLQLIMKKTEQENH